MKISIYNVKNGSVQLLQDIGSHFISLAWIENYNMAGQFTLELPCTTRMKQIIKPECLVKRTDRKTTMVIKSVQEKGYSLIAMGETVDRELDDISFLSTTNANTAIYSTLYSAYNNAPNKFPYIEVETTYTKVSDTCGMEISNKSLYELYEVLCKNKDIGFKAELNKSLKKVVVSIYKPELDNDLKFSTDFGNLMSSVMTISTESYKNYAVVLGEGEGSNRIIEYVDGRGDTSIQRRDLIVDARDLQRDDSETLSEYRARLRARGLEKLLEKVTALNVNFELPQGQFGQRFDLGDIITVILNDYNIVLQARITRYQASEKSGNKQEQISVGTPLITRRKI